MGPLVVVPQSLLTAQPGTVTRCPFTVRNGGGTVDEFTISIVGGAAMWADVVPPAVKLLPGQEAAVEVHFRPPQSAEVPAGRHIVGIRIVSSEDPSASVVEEVTVDVAPFGGVVVNLSPHRAESRTRAQVHVGLTNQGNAPIDVTLALEDPDESLEGSFDRRSISLAPGASERVGLAVKGRQRAWTGPVRSRQYWVIAQGAQDVARADGVFDQRALVGGWSIRIGSILGLLATLTTVAALVHLGPFAKKTEKVIAAQGPVTTTPNGSAANAMQAPALAAQTGGGSAPAAGSTSGGGGGGETTTTSAGSGGAANPTELTAPPAGGSGAPTTAVGGTPSPTAPTVPPSLVPGGPVLTIAPLAVPATSLRVFAWADQPTAANYTANAAYASNPGGAAPTVTRSAAGTYAVTFPGQNLGGGNSQVTAYGSKAICNVVGWSGTVINVRCNDGVDSRFTVTYSRNTGERYAWADQASTASYTPSTAYAANPGGASPTVTRSSAGTYAVTFPGQTLSGGNVQVTGYATTAECNVTGWGGSSASVACYDGAGNATDARFLVQYTQNTQDRYAWADQPSAANYAPSATFAANPGGSAPTASRSGVGSYALTLPGQNLVGGTVQVTAYGSKATCNVGGWGGAAITVSCNDGAGNPADSRYTVIYSKRVS